MIADRLARLLGVPPPRVRALGASHEWTLHRAELADGRAVFVKALTGRGGTLEGVFAAEASGLGWLGAAGAADAADAAGAAEMSGSAGPAATAEPTGAETAGTAPVPEVVAADEHTLVLPWLPPGEATAAAARRLGRELAALHAAGADSFGASWPGFIARLPLDNTREPSWPEWYARRRLAPYLRTAADAGDLSAADVGLVERAIEAVPEVAGPAEPAARIHGDLWSGNIVWSGGRGWLVDPAAHGGHRESDLAMLALFGAPRLDRILAAYQEVAPLADGWRARVPLHQLHPLLVHVALFGAGYRAAALDAARAVLRL